MTSTAIPRRSRPITVIGLGADGLAGLPEHTRALVLAAGTILGGPRHLALLPEVTGQVRVPWPSPLRAGLPGVLAEHAEVDLVALASGDPLVSGIAGTLIDLLGADSVRPEPAWAGPTSASR
jgi:precorrin-6Y C5,15-methyltransferase (decarboxylating)